MKEKANYQQLLLSILLILAGIISHSNGVDDLVSKSPYQLLSTIIIAITSTVLIYIIWEAIDNYKQSSNHKNYK
jgi:hypothetical protein